MPHFVISPSTASQVEVKMPIDTLAKRQVALMECILPKTIYNVRLDVNDMLDFKVGATTYAVTITPGAYTANTLCQAIQAAMQVAVANTWSVTYSNTSFLVTIAGVTNFELLFATGVNVSTSIASTIGFASTNTSGTNTYTGTGCVQLANPFSFYLRIKELGTNVYCSSGQGFAFRIPCVVDSGGIVEADINSDYPQVIKINRDITYYTITPTLCYADGTPVNLNGGGYEFVLNIE